MTTQNSLGTSAYDEIGAIERQGCAARQKRKKRQKPMLLPECYGFPWLKVLEVAAWLFLAAFLAGICVLAVARLEQGWTFPLVLAGAAFVVAKFFSRR